MISQVSKVHYVRGNRGKLIPIARVVKTPSIQPQADAKAKPLYNWKGQSFKKPTQAVELDDSTVDEVVARMLPSTSKIAAAKKQSLSMQWRTEMNKYRTPEQKKLKRQRHHRNQGPEKQLIRASKNLKNRSRMTAKAIEELKKTGTPESLQESKKKEKECELRLKQSKLFKAMHDTNCSDKFVKKTILNLKE